MYKKQNVEVGREKAWIETRCLLQHFFIGAESSGEEERHAMNLKSLNPHGL